MTSHPDMPQANEALKAASEQANKELAAQAANLSDKEKQDLIAQLEQRVELKRQALMIAIADKVNAAIKETGEAKGLKIVIQKDIVAYGGLDITDEVLKKITGK
ncbi:OmpH family outer membrane protein [Sporomusa ovata]|nr:OmpH family outer membrane protein [Sporomusa ovata]